MKTGLLRRTEKSYFVLTALLFVLLISESFGQNQKVSEMPQQKAALQNLVQGIQSENDGVRESSIHFAGKYKFIETEDVLINQLKVEKKSDIKVLIGLALYQMNSKRGMEEVSNLAKSDENPRVRKMSQAIYDEYLATNLNRTGTAQ